MEKGYPKSLLSVRRKHVHHYTDGVLKYTNEHTYRLIKKVKSDLGLTMIQLHTLDVNEKRRDVPTDIPRGWHLHAKYKTLNDRSKTLLHVTTPTPRQKTNAGRHERMVTARRVVVAWQRLHSLCSSSLVDTGTIVLLSRYSLHKYYNNIISLVVGRGRDKPQWLKYNV